MSNLADFAPYLMVLDVIIAVLLVIAIVLQPSKGNGMGSMFGGSNDFMGYRGQGLEGLLEKATIYLAISFGFINLVLARIAVG
jgi:protein translocase, SecG subunit